MADRDICRAASQAHEEELLNRFTDEITVGGEVRYQFPDMWPVAGLERDPALRLIRMCLGLGVVPARNVSVAALIGLYDRLEAIETRLNILNI